MRKVQVKLCSFIFILAAVLGVSAQSTEFSYQGYISDEGAPANGVYHFQFRIYTAATGGTPSTTIWRENVSVTKGVFNVTLDFGVLDADERFLEIGVRSSPSGPYTVLSPRSKLLSTPFATRSEVANFATTSESANTATQAANADNANLLNNLTSDDFILNRSFPQQTGDFNLDGDGTVSGMLSGAVVEADEYKIFGNRVLAKVGANNLFLGVLAGMNNGGARNTLLGDSAGRDNTGEENLFVGFVSGQVSTTGSSNTFLGSRSGMENRSGSFNTLVGYNADLGSGNLTNAGAFGANAFVEQSNAIVIGGVNGVNGATSHTDVGIGVTTPARRLDVNGNIRIGSVAGVIGCVEDRDGTVIAGTCSSDLRFKKNVRPFGPVLESFTSLRPVSFDWRTEEFSEKRFGDGRSYGLIAQDVERAFPDLVVTDEDGYRAVNYSKLPLYTIQAVIELKEENDSLKQQLAEQQRQIDELKKMILAQQNGGNKE